jgi:hypothetical protein
MGRKRGPRAKKNTGRNWKHVLWLIVAILISVSMVATLVIMSPVF